MRPLFFRIDFFTRFKAYANLHPRRISQHNQRAGGREAMDGISLPLSKFNPRRIEVARFEFSDQKWTRIPLSDRRVHQQTTEPNNEKEGQTGIYRIQGKNVRSVRLVLDSTWTHRSITWIKIYYRQKMIYHSSEFMGSKREHHSF